MFSKQRIKLFFINVWGPALGIGAGLVFVASLLTYKLGSLSGYSPAEVNSLSGATRLSDIAKQPFDWPYKIGEFGLRYIHHNNLLTTRLVPALFGLLAIGLFYYVLLQWHNSFIAALGAILFACSSWFLHYARVATPDILLTLLLGTIAYGAWARKTNRSGLVILLGAALGVSIIYVPGLIWFVIAGGIWQRKVIAEHINKAKISTLPISLVAIAVLAILAFAIFRHLSLIKPLLGLPTSLPNPYNYFRWVINVPYQVYFRGPNDPAFWLGRLPLVDFFAAVMSVLGAFYYYQKLSLDRSKIIFGGLIVGTLLVGLHGPVTSIVIMPFIYLLVIAGIAYLLKQWLSVYPRNPLARILGYGLIIIAVATSCTYNLRSYFVAWRNAPATKQAYSLRAD